MANNNEAKIKCTISIDGFVRKKKGRFPYYIYSSKFGPTFFNTPEGQEMIIAHMEEIEPEKVRQEKPEIVTTDDLITEPKPEKSKSKWSPLL